jgi:serine protease Do
MASILEQVNDKMAAVVECVRRSLVQISNGRRGTGAGVLWQTDGLIVTNAHVIRHHAPQVALADGRTLPARVLGTDSDHDLAALSIAAGGLPAIERSASWPLRPGQWVLALGYPWGVAGGVTAGVVIGVGVPPEMPRFQGALIQTSLHLRPGHSGGPLVDVHGRLVGINTMMAGPDVGLAIPLPVITAFLRRTLGYAEPEGL